MITREFDIDLARAISAGTDDGRIVTRDGIPVRIVCWDAKSIYPLIGLIDEGGKERPCSWTVEGKMDCHRGASRPSDLFLEYGEPEIDSREDAIESLLRDHAEGADLREVLRTAMEFADSHPANTDVKSHD